jgi:predicted MPP superfamily phosphohydrolase
VPVVVFIAVLLAIVALLHLHVWQRLVRDTVTRPRWRRAAGLAVLAGALLIVATMLAGPLPYRYEVWLTWSGYLWLGVLFYLWVALLVLELPVLLLRWLTRRRPRRAAPAPAEPAATQPAATQPVRTPPAPTAPAPAAEPGTAPVEATTAAADAGNLGPSAADAGNSDPSAADAGEVDLSRRRLLRRGAAIVAGLTAVGVSGYGVARAFGPPRTTRLSVPLARLDRRADGLRVAVIADIHVGPQYGARQVERVVELVNDLDADLVTVVGDMVSYEVGEVRASAAPLRRMRSRYGSFFVTGNHEYYTGHEEWIEAAEELGLRVLRNERVEIVHRGGAIDLAGVNDREGANYDDPPDYRAALGDRDPSRPVLLMAHQPVQVREAARYGVDLQLSGHTHGGQLFPFDLLVRLEQPVVSGLAEVDGTLVYVTNGAGFWGPPMRVGADPEVTLIELRAA